VLSQARVLFPTNNLKTLIPCPKHIEGPPHKHPKKLVDHTTNITPVTYEKKHTILAHHGHFLTLKQQQNNHQCPRPFQKPIHNTHKNKKGADLNGVIFYQEVGAWCFSFFDFVHRP